MKVESCRMFIRICLVIVGGLMAGLVSAQERTGSVKGKDGEAVEFATVVLLSGEEQKAVAITDTLGNFSLTIADGEYLLKIHNIAYQPLNDTINISSGVSELGTFEMGKSFFGLNEVVVTASPITYESDRFIMRISDSPAMLGKDAAEILRLAPGVWIDDNGISINGTSGTKVFINEKELLLSQKELANYLRNFQSSDIARVEVIPQAGAEYSADSRGGVLKIALRKRPDNGMTGNVMLRTAHGEHLQSYRPSVTMNARIDQWSLNALISGNTAGKSINESTSTRNFYTKESDSFFHSESRMNGKPSSGIGRLGTIFEANERNSLGAEVEYSFQNSNFPSSTGTLIRESGQVVNSSSDYRQKENDTNFATTFNYIHRLDTIGSVVKFIADYTNKGVDGDNDYHSVFEWNGEMTDSIYRNNSRSDYKIFSSDIILNKQLGNGMKYSAGAKYTQNNMSDSLLYESLHQSAWKPLADYNYTLKYTENIGAFYGTFSTNIGQLSISAGLRGEYTHTEGRNGNVRRDYFDLFPNINLTYSFNAMRTFMLIGQYSQNIQRPNLWYLNPNRIQYSEYSYMVGNPELRPTYINRFGLTAVYKYRYILSVGGNLHKDLIREVNKTDPTNPDVIYITPENHHNENHYFAALIFPVKFSEWCNLNANIVGVKQDIRGMENEDKMSHYLYFINMATNFTLPSKFFMELSYSGTSRLYSANSGIDPRHLFHASIKKQLFNEKLTATLGVNNIFNSKTSYFAHTEQFKMNSKGYEAQSSRFIQLGIQYHFKSGKSFKNREIESASSEEKSRLEKTSEIK